MPKLPDGPIFVENPDGTLLQGAPSGYREQTPPGTPRSQVLDLSQALSTDIIRVLARHETLFLLLLVLQLAVELIFETMHLEYRDDAIFELSLIYPTMSVRGLTTLYWLASAAEMLYFFFYFWLGIVAAIRGKPRLYQSLSTVALAGTLGQLPLAYLNRFNLLVFFLRFITYAYARFQWNLLQGILLIRDELIPQL
eukprot:TRINITY_DN10263_c0_g1_i1.p1 TRINITY_DN10263_c0_g1~~TRINITY_DN10263_c0_g1_i1.p1  ORF type:complete len:196 (+),score=47.36 TRINITY_DN10263_c0_g1_i1:222-809(+)